MASGIIEKSNNGLFDNEIEINGKYATMARFLKEDVGIFATFREAYLTAAIIGLLNNAKETKDSSEKVQAASIFPNELKNATLGYLVKNLKDTIHSQIPIDSPKYDDFKFDYTLINKAQCEKK